MRNGRALQLLREPGDLTHAVRLVERELAHAEVCVQDERRELRAAFERGEELVAEDLPPATLRVRDEAEEFGRLRQLPSESRIDGQRAGVLGSPSCLGEVVALP